PSSPMDPSVSTVGEAGVPPAGAQSSGGGLPAGRTAGSGRGGAVRGAQARSAVLGGDVRREERAGGDAERVGEEAERRWAWVLLPSLDLRNVPLRDPGSSTELRLREAGELPDGPERDGIHLHVSDPTFHPARDSAMYSYLDR